MEHVKYIHRYLVSMRINRDYTQEIEEVLEKESFLANIPSRTVRTAFLMRRAEKDPLFAALLREELPFDISFLDRGKGLGQSGTESEKATLLRNKLSGKIEYLYSEKRGDGVFYGLKLSKNAYEQLGDSSNALSFPYITIAKIFSESAANLTFFERPLSVVGNSDVKRCFSTLITHVCSLDLPLSITHYDLLYKHTNPLSVYRCYIYLEPSASWPEDSDAKSCAKTAFYCQLHRQSKHAIFIERESVTFSFKELYFNIRIILDTDKNSRYYVEQTLQQAVTAKGPDFWRKILMIKKVLMDVGVYPLHMDDMFVDAAVLSFSRVIAGDAQFVKEFFRSGLEVQNKLLDLDTLKVSRTGDRTKEGCLTLKTACHTYSMKIPSRKIMEYVRDSVSPICNWESTIFDSEGNLTSFSFALENTENDFVLSVETIEGAEEIVGALCTDFELGRPLYKDFITQEIMQDIRVLYSPSSQILAVKVLSNAPIDLVANVLISRTSFRYIKMLRKK